MFSFKHLRNLTWSCWKVKFVLRLLYWIMDLIRLYSRRPESNVWIYAVLKRQILLTALFKEFVENETPNSYCTLKQKLQ